MRPGNQCQNILVGRGGSLSSIPRNPPPTTSALVSFQHPRTLQPSKQTACIKQPWAAEIKGHTVFRLEIKRRSPLARSTSTYRGLIPIKTRSMLCFPIRTRVILLAQMRRRHAKRESDCTVRWKSKQTLKESNQSYFSCVSENTHTHTQMIYAHENKGSTNCQLLSIKCRLCPVIKSNFSEMFEFIIQSKQ